MALDIPSIPPVPDGLVEAAAMNRLVPFIGAGVSRLAGCPNWPEFAAKAIDSLVEQGALSPLQRNQLAHLSPRLKLSLAELTAREKNVNIAYKKILQPEGWKNNKDGRRIYAHIAALGSRFVTTNYDQWLDFLVPPFDSLSRSPDETSPPEENRKSLYLPEHMTPSKFDSPNCVVHLHGSIEDQSSMVLSTGDYIQRYAADRQRVGGQGENPVLSFLNFLFDKKTVLFLGYGLDELEILEYVIMKSRTSDKQIKEEKHYLLQGFYSIEEQYIVALQKYYAVFGVKLVPFLKDENDWGQLINVLEDWSKALPSNQDFLLEDFKVMGGLVNG